MNHGVTADVIQDFDIDWKAECVVSLF